jgi:hypothetical protein
MSCSEEPKAHEKLAVEKTDIQAQKQFRSEETPEKVCPSKKKA